MKPNYQLHTVELDEREITALGMPIMGPDILMHRMDTVILRAHQRIRENDARTDVRTLFGEAQREAISDRAVTDRILRGIIRSADVYLPKLTKEAIDKFWEDQSK